MTSKSTQNRLVNKLGIKDKHISSGLLSKKEHDLAVRIQALLPVKGCVDDSNQLFFCLRDQSKVFYLVKDNYGNYTLKIVIPCEDLYRIYNPEELINKKYTTKDISIQQSLEVMERLENFCKNNNINLFYSKEEKDN